MAEPNKPTTAPTATADVAQLARDLFVAKITHGGAHGKTLTFVATQCFEEAGAFIAYAESRGALVRKAS